MVKRPCKTSNVIVSGNVMVSFIFYNHIFLATFNLCTMYHNVEHRFRVYQSMYTTLVVYLVIYETENAIFVKNRARTRHTTGKVRLINKMFIKNNGDPILLGI